METFFPTGKPHLIKLKEPTSETQISAKKTPCSRFMEMLYMRRKYYVHTLKLYVNNKLFGEEGSP